MRHESSCLPSDPAFANKAGFNKPILHGLCSFGIAARHVVEAFAGNNPSRLKCVKARFTKHVFPGEQVQTEMWKESATRIVFQLRVVGRDAVAVGNAFVELHPEGRVEPATEAPQATPSTGGTAEAVFAQFKATFGRLSPESKSALQKKIAATFQFDIGSAPYHIDMKTGSIGSGAPPGTPNIVIAVAEKDFMDLAAGKLKGQAAYMKGLVKVKGNMMLAMKLDPLLQALSGTPPSKL